MTKNPSQIAAFIELVADHGTNITRGLISMLWTVLVFISAPELQFYRGLGHIF